MGEFSGSPVVRTQHFHCGGLGSIPGQGTRIPQATQHGQKNIVAMMRSCIKMMGWDKTTINRHISDLCLKGKKKKVNYTLNTKI